MPTTRNSIDDGHIFVYRLSEPFDMNQLVRLLEETKLIREQSTHKIHTLVNLQQLQKVPSGIIRMHGSPDLHHSTRGYMAVVGASPLMETFVTTILRLARFDTICFFLSDDEALTYLREKIDYE